MAPSAVRIALAIDAINCTINRLPKEFTAEDVMRIYKLSSTGSARMKISRFQKDHIVEKMGTVKGLAKYRKIGKMFC